METQKTLYVERMSKLLDILKLDNTSAENRLVRLFHKNNKSYIVISSLKNDDYMIFDVDNKDRWTDVIGIESLEDSVVDVVDKKRIEKVCRFLEQVNWQTSVVDTNGTLMNVYTYNEKWYIKFSIPYSNEEIKYTIDNEIINDEIIREAKAILWDRTSAILSERYKLDMNMNYGNYSLSLNINFPHFDINFPIESAKKNGLTRNNLSCCRI